KAITGPPAFATGLYKWNGSSWVFLGDGTSFPASPATNDYYRLAEHDISAEAASGAGGDKSKVSIAGALALNIIANDTEATVPGGATVNLHTNDLTLKAMSNEEDGAKADSDAKAGKVGIGASAAINVLVHNTTRAAVEDGATINCDVAGCGAFEISADSHHDVSTEDKAGSESTGAVALAPSVSIAIVEDQTTAYLGAGAALEFTGDAKIEAAEDLSSQLKADAAAAGKDVAIGAAVSINLIEPTTLAKVARDLTAGSITISASTDSSSEPKTMASAQGEKDVDKSSGKQSNDQVDKNGNTAGNTPTDGSGNSTPQASDSTDKGNSDSSSESGDSGGGVSIAAGISINWVIATNTATITGVHLTSGGLIKI